jgi:hypothetical protein
MFIIVVVVFVFVFVLFGVIFQEYGSSCVSLKLHFIKNSHKLFQVFNFTLNFEIHQKKKK